MYLGLGSPVRNEEILDLEAFHAVPDRVQSSGLDAFDALQGAQDRSPAPVEFFQLLTPKTQAPDLTLGEAARLGASETADEGRAKPGVDHLEYGLHGRRVDREFLGQGFEDGGGSH